MKSCCRLYISISSATSHFYVNSGPFWNSLLTCKFLSSVLRASPSILNQVSRSSSPAMQGSSAGLNVTLGSTTPSFSPLAGLQSAVGSTSASSTTSGYGWSYSQTSSYTQPTTYASTNPFLTGAYMSYTPGEVGFEKYNTIGSTKEVKSFFESYASAGDSSKFSGLGE